MRRMNVWWVATLWAPLVGCGTEEEAAPADAAVSLDAAEQDARVGDSAVGDSAVGDSAVGDSAVGDSAVGDGGVPEVAVAVTATLGAEGGTLSAPGDSEWAGVELTVPAGALAAPTAITVRIVYESTPLPASTERVGLQIAVEAEGAFARPVSLQLPYDLAAVARVGLAAPDVRGLRFEAGGWLVESPAAADDRHLTLELAAPAVVAAGVQLVAQAPVCTDCALATPALFDAALCAAAGLCIEQLPTPAVALHHGPVVPVLGTDHLVYLRPGDGGGMAVVAEVRTPSETTSQASVAFDLPTSAVSNLALGPDGALHLGLGSRGALKIPLLTAGEPTSTPTPSLGAVATSTNLTVRLDLTDPGPSLVLAGVANAESAGADAVGQMAVIQHNSPLEGASLGHPPSLRAHADYGSRVLLLGASGLYDIAFGVEGDQLAPDAGTVDRYVSAPGLSFGPQAPFAYGRLSIQAPGYAAVSRDGRQAALFVGTVGGVTFLRADGRAGFPVKALAISRNGPMLISGNSPELAIIAFEAPDLPPRRFQWTDAEPGSEAWEGALARSVIVTSERVVLSLEDGRVLSLQTRL